MRAAATPAPSNFVRVSAHAHPTLAVIPAEAGIHVDDFTPADGCSVSLPKATAAWIPAFAGMTNEGVGAGTAFAHRNRPIVLRSKSRMR